MKIGPLYNGDRLVLPKVRGAVTWLQRLRGLLFSPPLPADGGDALLIRPCSSIHTIGMRYDLDVVFLARDGKVMSIHSNVRPWRGCVQFGAHDALELRGGVAERVGLKVGDVLRWAA
ncbi:DUF192 domain-containing protein [Marilutibacter chinensis]|uniref:DUF192 domain-containing protein n=1 Tax=Marilutibacter chinensis TaxID=2912247 RepID=A0ABS9HZN4_9GAMM|nr:DUF192 domain-containing protein [Lysobacter chinensis]MCF7223594.1 DUF192 domain-containing protein [Lysobacter chinensis]